jgi:hypothetical protein
MSQKPEPSPSPRERGGAPLASWIELLTQPFVILAGVHLSVLAFQLPLVSQLPGWFYPFDRKPVGPPLLLFGLAALPALGWWLGRALERRRILAVLGLVVLGYGLQLGFAWSEGRGFDGLRDRIVRSGHAEFAEVAVGQPDFWGTLVGYEAKVRREELGRYAHTKPPGQLLFYMASERLARGFAKDGSPAARLEALRDLAAWTWPLLSYLVLVPLFFLVRSVTDERGAYLACLLYLVVPAVALITLHADQVLFPLLLTTVVWTAVIAQRRRSLAWAVGSGVLTWLSGLFSFALLLAGPVGLAFAAASDRDAPPASRWRLVGRTALGLAVGGAIGYGLGILLGYDFFSRLEDATRVHAEWKAWRPGPQETFYWAWLDLLEFGLWIGVPLAVLTLASWRRSMRSLAGGDVDGMVLPAVTMALVFLFLAFFGRTKAESARLWLPLVPICCALAADHLMSRGEAARGPAVALVLVLQWLTIVLTKTSQDFW